VTAPISEGGLGFTFKWNMGWMHDTLDYYKVDPFFRKGAHDKLTFAMWYEYSEKFMNPLSHDEVVHLKKSLLEKMPGDVWQKLANVRTLMGYSVTRPGKSLFFMGMELGTHHEWNHDASLEWHLLEDPKRRGLMEYVAALGALYKELPCLWRGDHDPHGYRWIDVADREQSVFSYARFDGRDHAIVVLNLTPVPRHAYRLGAPVQTSYRVALNSDAPQFGGSSYPVAVAAETEPLPYHGFEQSLTISLPPLSMLVLVPESLPPEELPVSVAVSAASVKGDAKVKKTKAPKPLKAPKEPKPAKAPKPAKEPKPAKAAKPPKPAKEPKAAKAEKAPKVAKVPSATAAKSSAAPARGTKPAVKRTRKPATAAAKPATAKATPADVSAVTPARPRSPRRRTTQTDAPKHEQ
jgi:1,4-alpha-glucan branching enzyme